MKGLRASLVLLAASTALGGATFREVDKEAEKREMIAKLSSNINKVDHSIEVTKANLDVRPEADFFINWTSLHVSTEIELVGINTKTTTQAHGLSIRWNRPHWQEREGH